MRLMRTFAITASVSLLLGAAACSKGDDDPGQNSNAAPSGIYFYGTDGNMFNEFGDYFNGGPISVAGMKGTFPLTPLTSEFKNRVLSIDSTLQSFSYSAEAYDAVMISSLAAQLAGTTEATEVAKHIIGVTSGGAVCKTIANCMALARNGRDLQYRGVSVRHGFTEAGEPSTTTYATEHYGLSNKIEDAKTEFLNTGNEGSASTKAAPKPGPTNKVTDKPLIFGLLVPQGKAILASQSPPVVAGARLAVSEVNAANGVLGKPVQIKLANDGTNPDVAKQSIRQHKQDGVQILIGPLTSGVSRLSLPEAIANKMIMFSPSATAAALSTVEDQGLYFFRTAPSDILQARAIADIMIRDGVRKLTIITHNGAYGKGLLEDVRKELARAGVGAAAILALTYDVTDDSKIKDPAQLTDYAQKTLGFAPDGVLILGYDESADMVKALVTAGITIRR